MPAGLIPVECPDEVKYLWGYFASLNGRRTAGFGLGPISHADFEAWMRTNGYQLSKFERDALNAIEHAWLAFHNDTKPQGEMAQADKDDD